jgi:hypothetical protein
MGYSLIEHDPVPLAALAGLLALGLLGFFLARRWPRTAWISVPVVVLRTGQLALSLAGMWTTDIHPDVTRFFVLRLIGLIAVGLVAITSPVAAAVRLRSRPAV